jgi:hypothetical protein
MAMPLPSRLSSLVVKRRVSLGLLGAVDRDLVLALAATRFEAGRSYREAEVNAVLAGWLDGPGTMLAADHVELRRWLVDLGFVSRDGFGRAYVRGPAETARAETLLGSSTSEAIDTAIGERRALHAVERESRRRAHAAR